MRYKKTIIDHANDIAEEMGAPEAVKGINRTVWVEAFIRLSASGGKSTSDAKRKASAANGKKGGRPKKTTD